MEQQTPYYLQQTLNRLLDQYFYEFAQGTRRLSDLMPEIYLYIKSHFETELSERLTIDWYENQLLIKSFEENIARWALARNYKQTKEISDFMYVNKGNMPMDKVAEFLNSSKARYNDAWLNTEIVTFRNTIENVKNWDALPKDPQVMLRYSTAQDERVRHSHALLDGLTMPKNDPRWTYLYPPPSSSPFNCRCRVIAVYDQPATQDVTSIVEDVAKFQKQSVKDVTSKVHPVFSGKMFNENETYFNGTPKKVLDNGISK